MDTIEITTWVGDTPELRARASVEVGRVTVWASAIYEAWTVEEGRAWQRGRGPYPSGAVGYDGGTVQAMQASQPIIDSSGIAGRLDEAVAAQDAIPCPATDAEWDREAYDRYTLYKLEELGPAAVELAGKPADELPAWGTLEQYGLGPRGA